MNLAIIFAAVTVIATTLGGYIALRASDRFHLVLGLSAGLLLGLPILSHLLLAAI